MDADELKALLRGGLSETSQDRLGTAGREWMALAADDVRELLACCHVCGRDCVELLVFEYDPRDRQAKTWGSCTACYQNMQPRRN